MVIPDNSDELMDMVMLPVGSLYRRGEVIELPERGPGQYWEIDGPKVARSLNLLGSNPLGCRVRVYGELKVRPYSRWQGLTMDTEEGELNFDNAAHSKFVDMRFNALHAPQAHYGKKYDDPSIIHKGVAIKTTAANDGDSSYGVEFLQGCMFSDYEVGIEIGTPSRKGTVAWYLERPIFNMCEYALLGTRVGKLHWVGGDVQVCVNGVHLESSHSNEIDTHFERGGMNVYLGENCKGNTVRHDSIRPNAQVVDLGKETTLIYYRSYNISRG